MSRIAIAYVVNSLDPGGTERLVVEMGLAFSDVYDVHVFTLDRPGAWAGRLRAAGISVVSLWRQPGIDLSVAVRLARQLRVIDARIVHAHQCSPWFYAALSRYLRPRTKLLLEEHGRFWPESDSVVRRLVNRIAIVPMTNRFVAVSRDIASRLVRFEGVPKRRIQVIYNGVPSADPVREQERDNVRAQFGIADDAFVIGAVGRLDSIKNLPLLIDAVQVAANTVPELRVVIVGDGPQRTAIESQLRKTGLERCVILAGTPR